jgi:hypothetical protein
VDEDDGLPAHRLDVEAPPLSQEVPQQPIPHVVQIRPALSEIAVLHAREGLADGLQRLLDGVLGVHLQLLHEGADLLQQPAILEDQQVRIEDPGVLGPDLLGDALLDLQDLAPRGLQRLLQARHLQGEPVRLHRLALDPWASQLDHQGPHHGDSRRDPDPSKDPWVHR